MKQAGLGIIQTDSETLNVMLDAVMEQRNAALDTVAMLRGQVFAAQQKIAELQKQIEDSKKPERVLAAVPAAGEKVGA